MIIITNDNIIMMMIRLIIIILKSQFQSVRHCGTQPTKHGRFVTHCHQVGLLGLVYMSVHMCLSEKTTPLSLTRHSQGQPMSVCLVFNYSASKTDPGLFQVGGRGESKVKGYIDDRF